MLLTATEVLQLRKKQEFDALDALMVLLAEALENFRRPTYTSNSVVIKIPDSYFHYQDDINNTVFNEFKKEAEKLGYDCKYNIYRDGMELLVTLPGK